MLILSRMEGEKVYIGPPENPVAIITVASIRGDKVRLAFEVADRSIPINREEIANRIIEEQHAKTNEPQNTQSPVSPIRDELEAGGLGS